MKKVLLMKQIVVVTASFILLCMAEMSHAALINFATGQDATGSIQTVRGVSDANWTFSGTNAYVVAPGSDNWWDSGPGNAWIGNTTTSAWIAPYPDDHTANGGTYVLNYTFDLTGYDLSTAQFTGGKWSIDNAGTLALNGQIFSTLEYGNWNNFLTLNAHDLPVYTLVQGLNTLTITSINGDYFYEAARLEGALTINPVPIPGAIWLLGSGIVGLVGLNRRRMRTK